MAVNQTAVRRPARWALGGVDKGRQVICMPESLGSPEGHLEVHVSIQEPTQDWTVQKVQVPELARTMEAFLRPRPSSC